MNVELVFSLGLALLILAVAGFVIVARGSFAAIVGFVAFGLLLSLALDGAFGSRRGAHRGGVGRRGDRGVAPWGLRSTAPVERGGRAARPRSGVARLWCFASESRRVWLASSVPAGSRAHACAGGKRIACVDGSGQCGDGGVDGLPGSRHDAGKGGAASGAGGCLVAGSGSFLGRASGVWFSCGRRAGPLIFLARVLIPIGIVVGDISFLGWRGCSGRRVCGRGDHCRDGNSRIFCGRVRGSRGERISPARLPSRSEWRSFSWSD